MSGGIDVPIVLGSRSTDVAASFGGFHGRALRTGDRIAANELEKTIRDFQIESARNKDSTGTRGFNSESFRQK